MPKPYSQDLRDRVIDAAKRGEMSRRAAARRYEISETVAIKWLERVERDGSREPVGHGGHRASKLMPHRDFLEAARAEKSDVTLQALGRSPFGRARGQSRHLDDEPLLSPDRPHGQKKTLVAREQDRADISRHRKRWRTYQGLIDPRRLVFIDETPPSRGQALDQEHPPARLGAKGAPVDKVP
jgi:transposase